MLIVCQPSSPRIAPWKIPLCYSKAKSNYANWHTACLSRWRSTTPATWTPASQWLPKKLLEFGVKAAFSWLFMKSIPKSLLPDPIMIFWERRTVCGSSLNGRSNSKRGKRFTTFYSLGRLLLFALTNLISLLVLSLCTQFVNLEGLPYYCLIVSDHFCNIFYNLHNGSHQQ